IKGSQVLIALIIVSPLNRKVKSFFNRTKRNYIRDSAYIKYYLEKCNRYHEIYNIPGTKNISGLNFYCNPKIYPSFQKDLTKFKELLVSLVNQKANVTFYKFGDGDYYFLKQLELGSAKPGVRALSKSYEEIDINEFREGALKNDYIITEIIPERYLMFKELFPERERDFPSEYCHGLVANRWFFKTFKGKIGLIGAKEKLEIIKRLMQHIEYKEYLGIDKFNDYIYIPQRFAADDVNKLEKSIAIQLNNSTSDIFLLGIGHVKSALLHRLKKYKEAVYVDVGGAIDAIAGIINIRRLHMAKWVNYQLKNYDYSDIDYMNYKGWGKHIYLNHSNSNKTDNNNLLSKIKSVLKVCFKRFKINLLLRFNFIYKNYLKLFKGLKFAPKPLIKVPWLNTTLKSREDVDLALKIIEDSNLNLHPNREKNWDSLIALKIILQNSTPFSRILDAGGDYDSIILHWLYQYNYKHLYALNLDFKKRLRKGNIENIPGDLTKTLFPDNYFDIITCLSVIEHGVDGDNYFREMNRILKPHGLLITSTDYWFSKIETVDLKAYNNPVYIFDKNSIEILLQKASKYHFRTFGKNIELNCQEKVVSWKRFNLNFTFLIFCLQKEK
ncbi:MAG: methyltransferase domain-containing protein, partial [Candidatus Thorarchaeota archaeon]